MKRRIEDLPDRMSVSQAAKFLGISEGTCYQQIRLGKIPAIKYGKRIVITKPMLAAHLGYGEAPKIEARTPKRVIAEIAELARSMAEMNQRLARICEEIGGEYGERDERAGDGVEAARDQESEGAATLH